MSDECNDIYLSSRVYKSESEIIFTDKDNNRVPVQTIRLDTDFKVESLTSLYEEDIDKDSVTLQRNVLNIPGVGLIVPGDRVVHKDKDYILLFGWHKNISNQEIYSWFLRPMFEDGYDKTLYKNMINEIDIVHFT